MSSDIIATIVKSAIGVGAAYANNYVRGYKKPALANSSRRGYATASRFRRGKGRNTGFSIKKMETRIYSVDYLIPGESNKALASLNNASYANLTSMTSDTGHDNIYYFYFSPSMIVNSALNALFDKVKIKAITFRILPQNTQIVPNTTSADYYYTSIDYDGRTATTVAQMAQETKTREHIGVQPATRFFYPRANQPTLTAQLGVGSSGGVNIRSPWFADPPNTNNAVFGLSVGFPIASTARAFDFTITLHMQYTERLL